MTPQEEFLIKIALEKEFITRMQLERAVSIRNSTEDKDIGEIFVELGFITKEHLIELRIRTETMPSIDILPETYDENDPDRTKSPKVAVFQKTSQKFSSSSKTTKNKNKGTSENKNFVLLDEEEQLSESQNNEMLQALFEDMADESDNLVGKEFVGCKVIKKIAEGGMGNVYKVKHLFLNKLMAMKLLPKKYTKKIQYVERFLREARSAAKLEQVNIVRIYDVGEQDGQYFMLLQYVDGFDLKKVLEHQKKLTVTDAEYIIIEVAKALEEAHKLHIIHRDIKPDNIMIEQHKILVTDFGLAKIEIGVDDPDAMKLTSPGQILGSPYFMAPEQADENGVVDNRTDIYSLGAPFYYLITCMRLLDIFYALSSRGE